MNKISVILNVYKRPYTLKNQIDAILNQSVKIDVEDIHIWYNTPEKSSDEQFFPDIPGIKTYWCNHNTKFLGRFLIPLLCKTEYIAMFDDDTIPHKNWFKNCLETMRTDRGLLGGSGVLLPKNGYQGNQKVGWNGIRAKIPIEVDLVGHAWFFKQEWTHYLWDEPPVSWNNGEDIMFSYVLQKYGIKTFVPPHPEDNQELWSNRLDSGMKLGNDNNASWRIREHNTERDDIVETLKSRGWRTVQ